MSATHFNRGPAYGMSAEVKSKCCHGATKLKGLKGQLFQYPSTDTDLCMSWDPSANSCNGPSDDIPPTSDSDEDTIAATSTEGSGVGPSGIMVVTPNDKTTCTPSMADSAYMIQEMHTSIHCNGSTVLKLLAQKYDPQREHELRQWIEEVTGKRIGESFMESLKDGVILCDLINKLQPGSVRKVNESTQNWHQLENIGNFIKAITKYGVKPHDIFEANDLFENTNHTQVQSTLIALASMAKTKGNKVNVGVKYAEKQQRKFLPEKLKEGRNIIGLQMGTNKFASQQGMTAYGTRRHLYDPKLGTDQPLDQATISLQMGTNKGASQAGMTAPGTKRQIFEPSLGMEHCDTQNISLQMGSNKGASQQGMTVYGLPRQVYDSKYCLTPNYPIIGEEEDQYNHSHHNFYNSE